VSYKIAIPERDVKLFWQEGRTVYWYCFLGATVVLALAHIVPNLRNLIYVHVLFDRRYRSDRTDHVPRVGVFVPCKGLFPELAGNLEALAQQEYEDFTVTYISESPEDPANETIEQIVRRYPHCRHVVSGPAASCGQKNHNLLKGIEQDAGSEVFVFCDSDIRPPPTWLSALMDTLGADDVSAATGFLWITPSPQTFGGTLHSMMVAYQATFISSPSMRTVWGGTMAIRSQTFERLNVAEEWRRTVVDDVTLCRLLRGQKVSKRYDPRCLVVSNEAASSVREAAEWFARQILYTKFYLRPIWLASLAVHVPTSLLMMAAAPLTLMSVFYDALRSAGLVCLGFSTVTMLAHTSMKLTCRDGQRALRWFLLSPLSQWISTYSLVKTAFTHRLRWGDVTYRLDRKGRVVELERAE